MVPQPVIPILFFPEDKRQSIWTFKNYNPIQPILTSFTYTDVMSFTRATTKALTLGTSLSIKVQPVLSAYYESQSTLMKRKKERSRINAV